MVKNNLFNSNQHGFLPRRNCTTQLLEVIESWYETIEKKGYIDVIYTDFAKAFDSVPHLSLIRKVESSIFNLFISLRRNTSKKKITIHKQTQKYLQVF